MNKLDNTSDTTDYDVNFEKLEKLRFEFQIKLFSEAMKDFNSHQAKMAIELLKASGLY